MYFFSDIFKPLRWHILACVVVFFIMPAFTYVVAPQHATAVMMLCTAANSLVILATTIILAIKEGFKWYYPLIIVVLYIMSTSIYQTDFMIPNAISYLILSYSAHIIGYIISKLIERNM